MNPKNCSIVFFALVSVSITNERERKENGKKREEEKSD